MTLLARPSCRSVSGGPIAQKAVPPSLGRGVAKDDMSLLPLPPTRLYGSYDNLC